MNKVSKNQPILASTINELIGREQGDKNNANGFGRERAKRGNIYQPFDLRYFDEEEKFGLHDGYINRANDSGYEPILVTGDPIAPQQDSGQVIALLDHARYLDKTEWSADSGNFALIGNYTWKDELFSYENVHPCNISTPSIGKVCALTANSDGENITITQGYVDNMVPENLNLSHNDTLYLEIKYKPDAMGDSGVGYWMGPGEATAAAFKIGSVPSDTEAEIDEDNGTVTGGTYNLRWADWDGPKKLSDRTGNVQTSFCDKFLYELSC